MKQRGKNNNYILLFFMFLLFCLMVLFMANSKSIQEGFENMMTSATPPKPFTLEYYYTEECPHCVSFNESKVWDELSSKAFKKVAFKKYLYKENIDRANKLNIHSFPMLVMVKTGTEQIVATYDGDRSLTDLTKFVMTYE